MERPWELKWQNYLPMFSWLKFKKADTKPKEWRRCIEDILPLWDSDEKDVEQFIEQANKFHPTTEATAKKESRKKSGKNENAGKKSGKNTESIQNFRRD